MCGVCGCSEPKSTSGGFTLVQKQQKAGVLPQHHPHPSEHHVRMIQVEQDILSKNNQYAAKNRAYFQQQGILALNFVSSPGAGKTTLLVATIEALKNQLTIAVIEGDQQTERDADRIRATGAQALQINTGKACHLDALEITKAVETLQPGAGSVLAIENVGNLVCPASFDLGEACKVVVLSVTEGDDKPIKYPDMFHAAQLMIINKIDLLPYVNFEVDKCIEFAKRVNPTIEVLQVTATQADSLIPWTNWILNKNNLKND